MLPHIHVPREFLPANLAGKPKLVLAVRPQMSAEISLVGKAELANLT